jgi:hypothetical protein
MYIINNNIIYIIYIVYIDIYIYSIIIKYQRHLLTTDLSRSISALKRGTM